MCSSSHSSSRIAASSVSDCVLTETYSPPAIDNAPATRPARPATRMVLRSWVAPATPTTRPAVDTMPSLAPSTPARSQFSRLARPDWCASRWCRAASSLTSSSRWVGSTLGGGQRPVLLLAEDEPVSDHAARAPLWPISTTCTSVPTATITGSTTSTAERARPRCCGRSPRIPSSQ